MSLAGIKSNYRVWSDMLRTCREIQAIKFKHLNQVLPQRFRHTAPSKPNQIATTTASPVVPISSTHLRRLSIDDTSLCPLSGRRRLRRSRSTTYRPSRATSSGFNAARRYRQSHGWCTATAVTPTLQHCLVVGALPCRKCSRGRATPWCLLVLLVIRRNVLHGVEREANRLSVSRHFVLRLHGRRDPGGKIFS